MQKRLFVASLFYLEAVPSSLGTLQGSSVTMSHLWDCQRTLVGQQLCSASSTIPLHIRTVLLVSWKPAPSQQALGDFCHSNEIPEVSHLRRTETDLTEDSRALWQTSSWRLCMQGHASRISKGDGAHTGPFHPTFHPVASLNITV